MELAADEEAVLSCGDLALAADADAAGVACAQSTYDVPTHLLFLKLSPPSHLQNSRNLAIYFHFLGHQMWMS